MERDYKLQKEAYQETIWFIRQYEQYKKQYRYLISLRAVNYGVKRSGSRVSDPTVAAVIRSEKVKGKIDCIDKGLSMIPECYRQGIMENIIQRKPYPYYADPTTWKRWKRRLIYFIYVEKEGEPIWS